MLVALFDVIADDSSILGKFSIVIGGPGLAAKFIVVVDGRAG